VAPAFADEDGALASRCEMQSTSLPVQCLFWRTEFPPQTKDGEHHIGISVAGYAMTTITLKTEHRSTPNHDCGCYFTTGETGNYNVPLTPTP
jgi:hypothetical protein